MGRHNVPYSTFIILAEFPHYRISIVSPLLNHISVIQHKTYSNQPSRHDLGARLTHTYAPNFPIIIFNFATSTFICVLHIFAYYVNFVPAHLDVHYSLSPMRLLRLDIPPLQPICTTFAPNSTLYTSLANTFPEKWPFLACLANIIKFARNHPKACTSHASYQLVECLYTPHSASHWCAFNLQHVVQEFILPVTSPPLELQSKRLDGEELSTLSAPALCLLTLAYTTTTTRFSCASKKNIYLCCFIGYHIFYPGFHPALFHFTFSHNTLSKELISH
jgi:hypothetical protein